MSQGKLPRQSRFGTSAKLLRNPHSEYACEIICEPPTKSLASRGFLSKKSWSRGLELG